MDERWKITELDQDPSFFEGSYVSQNDYYSTACDIFNMGGDSGNSDTSIRSYDVLNDNWVPHALTYLYSTNAKMGPTKHGRRKSESDTRAKCRLFEQRENKVEKVEKVEKERAPLVLSLLLSQTERAEALVVASTAALILSTRVQAAIPRR